MFVRLTIDTDFDDIDTISDLTCTVLYQAIFPATPAKETTEEPNDSSKVCSLSVKQNIIHKRKIDYNFAQFIAPAIRDNERTKRKLESVQTFSQTEHYS